MLKTRVIYFRNDRKDRFVEGACSQMEWLRAEFGELPNEFLSQCSACSSVLDLARSSCDIALIIDENLLQVFICRAVLQLSDAEVARWTLLWVQRGFPYERVLPQPLDILLTNCPVTYEVLRRHKGRQHHPVALAHDLEAVCESVAAASAARNNQLAQVKSFLERFPGFRDSPCASSGSTLLWEAARGGAVDVVVALLQEFHCDPNVRSLVGLQTAAHAAVRGQALAVGGGKEFSDILKVIVKIHSKSLVQSVLCLQGVAAIWMQDAFERQRFGCCGSDAGRKREEAGVAGRGAARRCVGTPAKERLAHQATAGEKYGICDVAFIQNQSQEVFSDGISQ
jgi:hypothetical protein